MASHADSRDYLQLCQSCQLTKAAQNNTNARSLATGAIMDQFSLDIIGSFRPTSDEPTHCLIQRLKPVLKPYIMDYLPDLVSAVFCIWIEQRILRGS